MVKLTHTGFPGGTLHLDHDLAEVLCAFQVFVGVPSLAEGKDAIDDRTDLRYFKEPVEVFQHAPAAHEDAA